jgi:hypothetical protein
MSQELTKILQDLTDGSQRIKDSNQNFGWRWWIISVIGLALWVVGGLVISRGVHIIDEFVSMELPIVILGLTNIPIMGREWVFLQRGLSFICPARQRS